MRVGGKGEFGAYRDKRGGVCVGASRCIGRGAAEEGFRDATCKVGGNGVRDGKGEAKGAARDIEAGPGGEEVRRGCCKPAVAFGGGGGVDGNETAEEGVNHQA